MQPPVRAAVTAAVSQVRPAAVTAEEVAATAVVGAEAAVAVAVAVVNSFNKKSGCIDRRVVIVAVFCLKSSLVFFSAYLPYGGA